MTTTVPDVEAIAHLDFEPAPPCGMKPCRDNPEPAIQICNMVMPCCSSKAPICQHCTDLARQAATVHLTLQCVDHGGRACSHTVYRFEPLP